jgi:hypothetical protein
MPAYNDRLFDPPAPFAYIELRDPESAKHLSDVPMLLDSGADVTLIPGVVLEKLNISNIPDVQYELVGFDGQIQRANVVRLELRFCRRTFRGQFLIMDQEWGILGRNVLNGVRVVLDGPALRWDESTN